MIIIALVCLVTSGIVFLTLIKKPNGLDFQKLPTTKCSQSQTYSNLDKAFENRTTACALVLYRFNDEQKLATKLGSLVNLKSLNIQDSEVSVLPEEIGQLKQLKELSLSSYYSKIKFTQIPDSIGNLKKLERLSIGGTQIEKLPLSIVNLKNLRYLNIGDGGVRSLLKGISNWENLETFIVPAYIEIPTEIGYLSKLKTLNASVTRLSPDTLISIANLLELRELHMSGSKLKELPSDLGNLKNLETLRLENNQLKQLPSEFSNLKNLKVLHLENNQFSPKEQERIRQLLPNTKIHFIPEPVSIES